MAYVVIAVCFGLAGGIIGRIKGSSFLLWFLISGALPFVGLMAAIAYRFDREELRRQCPTCGRVVKLHDALCTRCGSELDFPERALVPESASSSSAAETGAGSTGSGRPTRSGRRLTPRPRV